MIAPTLTTQAVKQNLQHTTRQHASYKLQRRIRSGHIQALHYARLLEISRRNFRRGSMAGTIGAVKTCCELSEVRSRSLQLEAFSMTSRHSVRDGQLILAFIAASPSCSSPVLR